MINNNNNNKTTTTILLLLIIIIIILMIIIIMRILNRLIKHACESSIGPSAYKYLLAVSSKILPLYSLLLYISKLDYECLSR